MPLRANEDPGAAPTSDPNLILGLKKGLAVIEAFDDEHERLTAAEVAALTGFSRAAARRCLLTLEMLGYAVSEGRAFRLSPRILRLGHAYLTSTPLPQLLQPFIEQVSEATSESCSVSILDGEEIIYIARASIRRVMSIGLGVGSRLPAYCTAMGRVLLAALPPGEAEALLARTQRRRLTPHTRTEVAVLMAILAEVRATGHCIVDQELEVGLVSVAVPVIDSQGNTLAAMNVGVQALRLTPQRMTGTLLPTLREAQRQVRPLVRR